MRTVLPVALFALAGLLVGGAWSAYRQGAGRPVLVLLGALILLSTTAGVVWLLPEGS
jgi:hypothetical protein